MEYVRIHRGQDGHTLDATRYLDRLGEFADQLPPGARAFAVEPEHYDFPGRRCVKDLRPLALTIGDRDATRGQAGTPDSVDGAHRWAELRLGHDCWKHDEDLTIRYDGVRSVVGEPGTAVAEVGRLSAVVLDELLPHEHGCRHEIAFLAGSLTFTFADLTATWSEADCPER